MTIEHKVFIGIGVATVLIMVGGIFLLTKQNERLNKPLIGQEVKEEGRNHVPEGTQITYNSNPPASGPHYVKTAHGGIYEKDNIPVDGYLVHSLEHGAVILWYKPELPNADTEKLKNIFNEMPGKKIMVPRASLDVPVAVSSWGRVLKLQAIDENQIKSFFETNNNRAPENAPI